MGRTFRCVNSAKCVTTRSPRRLPISAGADFGGAHISVCKLTEMCDRLICVTTEIGGAADFVRSLNSVGIVHQFRRPPDYVTVAINGGRQFCRNTGTSYQTIAKESAPSGLG